MAIDCFVGREHELQQLSRSLETVLAEKRSKFFLIEGDFGQGKTVLIQHFLNRVKQAHPDLLMGTGLCTTANELSGLVPFGQLVEQLSEQGARQHMINADWREFLKNIAPAWISIIPVIGNAAAAVAQTAAEGSKFLSKSSFIQENVFVQFTNFLSNLAKRQPLVMVLDDVQWADPASLDLLTHLTHVTPNLEELPVLFVCVYRPEANSNQRFSEFYARLRRYGRSAELTLTQGIDAHEYVQKRYCSHQFPKSWIDKIQRVTEGHPLFINQLFSLWEDTEIIAHDGINWKVITDKEVAINIPENMQAVLKGRLSGLEDELYQILSWAAVQGDEFTLQGISGPGEWSEYKVSNFLEILNKRYGFVFEVGEQEIGDVIINTYRFSHRFFRDYIYEKMPTSGRRIKHEEIAKCLEKLYELNIHPVAADLAIHFYKARRFYESASYALMAAQFEQARYAWTAAQGWYEFGLKLIDKLPKTSELKKLEIDLLDQSGDGFYRIGSYIKAEQNYRKGLILAKAANDCKKEIEFNTKLADACDYQGKIDEALIFAEKAQEKLNKVRDIIPFCELHVKVAWIDSVIKFGLGRKTEAAKEIENILLKTESLPQTKEVKFITARIYNLLGIISKELNDYRKAESSYLDAISLLNSIGEIGLAASYSVNLSQTYYERLDRFDEAIKLIVKSLKIHEKIGDLDSIQFTKDVHGGLLLALGKYSQALLVLEEAKTIIESYKTDFWWNIREVYARLALACLSLKDIEKSHYYSVESLSKAIKGRQIAGVAHSYYVFGQVEAARQRWDSAQKNLNKAIEIYKKIGDRHFVAQVKRNLADTLLKQNKISEAASLLKEAMQVFQELNLEHEIIKTQPLLDAIQGASQP